MLGLVLIGLYFLAQQGWITVHWEQVSEGIEQGSRGAGQWMQSMLAQLSPSLVGLTAGFFVGLKVR